MPSSGPSSPAIVPRVNSVDSGFFEDDLAAVVLPGVSAVSVPKIGSAQALLHAEERLRRAEAAAGLPEASLGLLPWIETASGIANAADICAASPRVVAVCWGADDFGQLGRGRGGSRDPAPLGPGDGVGIRDVDRDGRIVVVCLGDSNTERTPARPVSWVNWPGDSVS